MVGVGPEDAQVVVGLVVGVVLVEHRQPLQDQRRPAGTDETDEHGTHPRLQSDRHPPFPRRGPEGATRQRPVGVHLALGHVDALQPLDEPE